MASDGRAGRRLRIGMLVRSLGTFRGGVDVYVRELTNALTVVASASGHEVRVYSDDSAVADEFARIGAVAAVVPMGLFGRLRWDHVSTPRRCARDHVDVVISPRSFRPMFLAGRSIAVVYHMMYHDIRHQVPWWDHSYFRTLHRLSLSRSDAVVVFSRFTESRIVARVPGVAPGRIRLIAPGPPDAEFRPEEDGDDTRDALRRLGVRPPYVLAVGAQPRKNVDTIIRAVAALGADRGLALVLVSAWSEAKHIRSLTSLAAALGMAARFHVIAGCAKDDLARLYRGAAAFVYGSSYEGIGIPPLESMASGCPVVAARAASIPEIVGDGALMTAPRDVDAVAAALRRVVDDPVERAQLRAAGFEVVRRLDWTRSARELLAVATEIAAS